jgi:hypothetical protein
MFSRPEWEPEMLSTRAFRWSGAMLSAAGLLCIALSQLGVEPFLRSADRDRWRLTLVYALAGPVVCLLLWGVHALTRRAAGRARLARALEVGRHLTFGGGVAAVAGFGLGLLGALGIGVRWGVTGLTSLEIGGLVLVTIGVPVVAVGLFLIGLAVAETATRAPILPRWALPGLPLVAVLLPLIVATRYPPLLALFGVGWALLGVGMAVTRPPE